MKKFGKTQLIAAACALAGSYQSATAQFSLSGQYKPRTEFRHGFKKLIGNEDPAVFTEHRARIIANYAADKYVFRLSFQDVRTWGSTGQINKSDGLFSAHEAWGKYLFTPKFSMTAGRQEIIFDDSRIWGNLDWAMQGRSHDALRFTYADSTWELNVIGAWNQTGDPEPAKLTGTSYVDAGAGGFATLGGGLPNPKTFQLAHFNKNLGKSNVSLQFLNQGMQAGVRDSVRFMQMAGANANLVFGNFKVSPTFYYQFGKADKSESRTKSAYLAHLDLTYAGLKKYTPTIGADYLTGDDSETADKNETFDVLYGTHHIFYGLMDYFYVGSAHGNRGLVDVYLKNKITVSEKLSLSGDIHYFMAQSTITKPDGSDASSALGTEVDLTATYKMAPGVTLLGGYSQMFATESMEILKGGDKDKLQNWAWLMLAFTPKFM